MKYNCLSCLSPGEYGEILFIRCESTIKRRLEDLGFIEGTRVCCLQKSPLGDPVAFGVRGAVIALREEESKNIFIK